MNPQILFPCVLMVLLWMPGAATAQVTVTALGVGLDPIESTSDVRLQHVDFTETESLEIGAELEVGELLTSLGEGLFVELSCPEGSKLHFTGTFQVLINPPGEDVDCAVRLDAGKLDVLTDTDTEVESGEVTLGSEGTRYAVRLDEASGKLERVLVFEGEVTVETPERTGRIATGRTLSFENQGTGPREAAVTKAEIDRWAHLYARFNAIQAKAGGADPDIAELTRLHAKVLKRPQSRRPRTQLADAQASYQLAEASYHRVRTPGASTPRDPYTGPEGVTFGEGDIIGVIADDRGQTLPGVTVTLSGSGIMGNRVAISNASGQFRFRGLPPGGYQVQYSLDGFSSVTYELDVASGTNSIRVTMTRESSRRTIDVIGG